MSTFEVRRFFTLSSVLRRRFRSRSRLGAALQLGLVRMTGTTLDAFDHVPGAVLEHVGHEMGMSAPVLDVNRNLWLSRVDPKCRRHAVGTYTHVLDQWGIVYDQPLLLATRQAGAAFEGAVRQPITHLERLAVEIG